MNPSLPETSPLGRALLQKRVLVCVGSGGVGKTTVAASLALRAAAAGRKVLVLTIDPAKRLADALGLAELGNVERRVEAAAFEKAGLPMEGELWAMMLDLKRSWDDFILRSVPADKQEEILQNRFYRTLSSALAGSQEYIAMEKLYELYVAGGYDLLVLDTPPTAHALDFLDAPKRVLDFLDSDTLRVLLQPGMAAGKIGLRLFSLGGTLVARTLARITGAEALEELAAFMLQLRGAYDLFKDRAAKVKDLLASREAAFVLVTSPQAMPVDEAIYFHERLREDGISLAAVVANRVHADPLDGQELPGREALGEALAPAGVDEALAARLHLTLEEARSLATLDAAQFARLGAATAPTPRLSVPRFSRDVYDFPGLWAVGAHLLPGEEPWAEPSTTSKSRPAPPRSSST